MRLSVTRSPLLQWQIDLKSRREVCKSVKSWRLDGFISKNRPTELHKSLITEILSLVGGNRFSSDTGRPALSDTRGQSCTFRRLPNLLRSRPKRSIPVIHGLKPNSNRRHSSGSKSLFQEHKKMIAYRTTAVLEFLAGSVRSKFQKHKTLSTEAPRRVDNCESNSNRRHFGRRTINVAFTNFAIGRDCNRVRSQRLRTGRR
jgi:hypothetical protein